MTETAPKALIVMKAIATPTRRLPIGMVVTEADIDGPVTPAEWLRLGHLERQNELLPVEVTAGVEAAPGSPRAKAPRVEPAPSVSDA